MFWILLFLPSLLLGDLRLEEPLYDAESMRSMPVYYQGRFRPSEVAAKQWWKEFYGEESYQKTSAHEMLWRFHLLGHYPFAEEALFSWEEQTEHLSYQEIVRNNKTLPESTEFQQKLAHYLSWQGTRGKDPYEASYHELKKEGLTPQAISERLEKSFPVAERLKRVAGEIRVIPGRFVHGEWFPLAALELQVYDPAEDALVPLPNFSIYPAGLISELRGLYRDLKLASVNPDLNPTEGVSEALGRHFWEGYQQLAGSPYLRSKEKMLTYPSEWQLKAELWLYRLPLIEVAAVIYFLSALVYLTHLQSRPPWVAPALLTTGMLVHSVPLALRCYVLERPPVTNMFETVLYVPWVTAVVGVLIRSDWLRLGAALGASGLLSLLVVTGIDRTMENVQAVLDSQYWLIVHVLMVVGSYGVFILAGMLGHLYLLFFRGEETEKIRALGHAMLTSMWIGVALLIPGTILGGVWAAQSWGRFWDWDPKESWAFISACVYLIWIHAHTYGYVRFYGLAMGAVTGLLTISFTWYGVNYVLGTGLHSYGFGSGNHIYYYVYLLLELLFLAYIAMRNRTSKKLENKPL